MLLMFKELLETKEVNEHKNEIGFCALQSKICDLVTIFKFSNFSIDIDVHRIT